MLRSRSSWEVRVWQTATAGVRIKAAANLKTAYIYFNNDIEVFVVGTAIDLRNYLENWQEE